MKIRKKITLWISGTALLSTLAFSTIIFFELTEEPFKIIDNEIRYMTQSLAKNIAGLPGTEDGNGLSNMPYNPDDYWIRATDSSGRVLYQSRIAHFIDIPPAGHKTTYLTEKNIPRNQISLGQDDDDDVLFRVMVTTAVFDNRTITIRIAKPIEDFEEEIIDLIEFLILSLVICTLIIILISYALAGKILTPVVSITRMAKQISSNSLHRRIPLSGNKDELFELSLSLNKMFDRLEYSFQRQKEFIGNASHELKSPITLIMLAQEEMLMNENLSTAAKKSLTKQLDSTRRMSHLVRNLLDLSRLEQQETLVRENVRMEDLIDRVLNDYSDLLASKSINVQKKTTPSISLSGDSEKLFRLLINLIDNSIRYNLTKDGLITIRCEKTSQGVLLEVANTGGPIPQQDIERVFEQFYRVEKSRSAIHGGSGLGLAIAQKIVDLHDGTIRIDNETGPMIKVSVFLPSTP